MNSLKTVNVKQLEEEFKSQFPDLSNETILACINQHGPDKETCIKILKDIKQNYIPLQQMDKFNSEELSDKQEIYDFKFNNYGFQDDHKPLVKDMDNLLIVDRKENVDRNRIGNENSTAVLENQSIHVTNGNFLPARKSSASNVYELSSHYAFSSGYGDVPQIRNAYMVDQGRMPKVSTQYVPNYARGFSYPVTNNGNVPYNSQFPHPVSCSGFSGEMKTKDYSMPLYVMVTSASTYSSPVLTTAQPRLVLQSPNLPQSSYYPPVLSHLAPPYHATRISPIPFSHSSSSSSSPHYPTSVTPTPPPPPPPSLSTSNANGPPLITYTYQGQFYFAENHQRSNEMPNLQNYKLYSENTSGNIMNQNTIFNLPTAITPQLSEVLFIPDHQIKEVKENKVEKAYEKALIDHQKMQLQMLHFELYKHKQFSYALRKDVNLLEERLQGKRRNEFINMEEIQKLREENMQLRVDCKCLTLEVDMQQKGQMRLGVVDEGFYKNIFTGPPIPNLNSEKKLNLTPAASKGNRYEGDDDEDNQSNKWNCSICTYANHPALDLCEMCFHSRPRPADG
ncbi:TGF-beta-activated kinase 1 and MAP3K7-binding protein 2-like [Centruroides sculpturatus]|uniref:TGF-beta-activated kinase 1 and MAP3K7-binding protein 2-like n=1 Tax=Centruroides sculpturatus TaxID=218467 RepID=UPI000C6D0E22|nr:TGF-beta-activated kinase 1 and MAP3K7-binding protein 2-like [Centruroides sculpturatus]XP_023241790.1 TGF-beta-activated kinase 1 and MAP3K7-binding protein 2-like [Centruroides sculpturatus]